MEQSLQDCIRSAETRHLELRHIENKKEPCKMQTSKTLKIHYENFNLKSLWEQQDSNL